MTTGTIRYEVTAYCDGRGVKHVAVEVPMPEVDRVLGEAHQGDPEQDRRLIGALLEAGAPEWIARPEGGYIDGPTADRPATWGIYGPSQRGVGR